MCNGLCGFGDLILQCNFKKNRNLIFQLKNEIIKGLRK